MRARLLLTACPSLERQHQRHHTKRPTFPRIQRSVHPDRKSDMSPFASLALTVKPQIVAGVGFACVEIVLVFSLQSLEGQEPAGQSLADGLVFFSELLPVNAAPLLIARGLPAWFLFCALLNIAIVVPGLRLLQPSRLTAY